MEYTNFNVKIDSRIYEELKEKVKSNGMNMTAFLRLAIRNFDLLLSLQEANNESNNNFLADLHKRVAELEKRVGNLDSEALREVTERYRLGVFNETPVGGAPVVRRRGFNVEED